MISALSIIFLPKGRVSSPAIVNSQPQPESPESKLAAAEASSSAEPSSTSAAPEAALAPPDPSIIPELKKKEPALDRETATSANQQRRQLKPPKRPTNLHRNRSRRRRHLRPPRNPKRRRSRRATETRPKRRAPPLQLPLTRRPPVRSPPKPRTVRKRGDDKDKKKGGFFKVFKKIFGKD